MAFTPEQLVAVAGLLAAASDARAAATAVRARLAVSRVTVVDPMDVRDEKPAFRVGDIAVYLMASDGHCWSTTSNPASADGLLLAGGPDE